MLYKTNSYSIFSDEKQSDEKQSDEKQVVRFSPFLLLNSHSSTCTCGQARPAHKSTLPKKQFLFRKLINKLAMKRVRALEDMIDTLIY